MPRAVSCPTRSAWAAASSSSSSFPTLEIDRLRMRGLFLSLTVGALLFAGLPNPSQATVFHSREEALRLAFPEADRTEPRDFFLTPEQRSEIEQRAKANLQSSLITVYI